MTAVEAERLTRVVEAARGWRHGNCSGLALIEVVDAYEGEVAAGCPVCVPGGTGPECAACVAAEDALAKRREDR